MSVRHYFEDRCNSDVNGHAFWKTVTPFMSNKGPKGENVMLREDSHIVTEDSEIADILNTYFSTIADDIGVPDYISDNDSIGSIVQMHSNHPIIVKIISRTNECIFLFSHMSLQMMCGNR